MKKFILALSLLSLPTIGFADGWSKDDSWGSHDYVSGQSDSPWSVECGLGNVSSIEQAYSCRRQILQSKENQQKRMESLKQRQQKETEAYKKDLRIQKEIQDILSGKKDDHISVE